MTMLDAIEIKTYLKQLQAKRALTGEPALDEAIAAAADAYTAAAVTEIATFRGELYGRQQG